MSNWALHLLRVALIVVFIATLIGIIAYARGYRLNVNNQIVTSTGILAVSANQKASKIYVNGQLKGATDLNITLPPGEYVVEVKKEGYTDWSKKINLKGEIVMSLDAALYPHNPSLTPLSNLGISKAVRIDQGNRILIFSDTGDIEKDGIYIFDADKKPISFFPPLKLILLKKTIPFEINLKDTDVYFSPDYQQAIIDFHTATKTYSYLIYLDNLNTDPFDVSTSKETLLNAWYDKKNKNITKIIEALPKDLRQVASDSFHIASFSPDETKILYQATREITLPPIITPPLIGANQTPEERSIHVGKFYIYDIKEDKNFILPIDIEAKQQTNGLLKPTAAPIANLYQNQELSDYDKILWYPDSKHIVVQQPKEMTIFDYDGTNKRSVYSGPTEGTFFSVTNEGELLILANINPQVNSFADLYEVGIK